MLDIRFIRENAEQVKRGAERKGFGQVDIDRLLQVDADLRAAKQGLQEIATKKNKAGGQISKLSGDEKQAAIDELVDVLGEAGLITNTKGLKKAVWEREQQRTTGIGEGLAIPHGKSDCSAELTMAVGRPAHPIDFNSVDKKPVKLIILLASPPDKTADHIQALGKIGRLMADSNFRETVCAVESAEELYELFLKAEREKG